jgi:N-acetylglucosamine-6-phosphate deacetylase
VTTALVGARVFDGTRLLEGKAVLVDGGRIAGLRATSDVPGAVHRRRIEGLLAPGFNDIQVNGGGGVLFNADLTPQGIAAIGKAHRRFGTTGFLPTLITGRPELTAAAIAAVDAALDQGVPGLLGIHLEGPFLNPERRGAHDGSLMRAMTAADVKAVASLAKGKTLMTLAPEKVGAGEIAALAAAGVILSIGHSAATYAQIRAARAAGVSGFTHIFNAMPPLYGREPGPVGAAMDDPEAWCSVIADLEHVAEPNLRIVFAARGWERTILISDAMPTVGSDIDRFEIDGRVIVKRGARLTTEDDVLAGCHLDMATAVRNSVNRVGLPVEAALHMAARAPAEFLGLGGELGQIQPGYRANLVLLDDDLQVVETWIDGKATVD